MRRKVPSVDSAASDTSSGPSDHRQRDIRAPLLAGARSHRRDGERGPRSRLPRARIRRRFWLRILLCTATSDAQGTLGGLVESAARIDTYLKLAVDISRLCSNDPVCAQHQPDNRQEDRLLAGAACHGCVLLAESSCERRNDFLDRALVVPTVDGEGAAFFDVDNA